MFVDLVLPNERVLSLADRCFDAESKGVGGATTLLRVLAGCAELKDGSVQIDWWTFFGTANFWTESFSVVLKKLCREGFSILA